MTDDVLEQLLAPIEGDAPTGPDLEYDDDFLALERAAESKPERVMGDEVKAAEEPDWSEVAEKATALLGRAKDLRAAVHLAAAWLHTDGLPGWARGTTLVRGLLDSFWDGVHPQLDSEDDNDPTERVSAVAPIASPRGVLAHLQATPFVQSPRLGRFSLRDLRIANGEIKPPAATSDDDEGAAAPASLKEIEACCMDCDEADLIATLDAIGAAMENAQAIDALFSEQVGAAGPDLKPLLTDLLELRGFVGTQVARRNPEAAPEGLVEADAGAGGAASAPGGPIKGAQDVLRRIDEICDYYERAEPSSPVPLLLRRAQRLVGRSFSDLVDDLVPSGVSELQVISGRNDDQ